MRNSIAVVFLALIGCAGVTGLSDSNIPERGQKYWVDPKASKGLDHPLVSTLGGSGFCCVPLEPYNSQVRQFEIIGKRQTLASGSQRLDLYDIKFDDGYGAGMTQRAFIRQSDLKLFPKDDPGAKHEATGLEASPVGGAKTKTGPYAHLLNKTFWTNPKSIGTTDFLSKLDDRSSLVKFNQKRKFTVVGIDEGRFGYEWLRVRFEDGSKGYTSASGFIVGEPEKHGDRALYSPILPDDPDKIAAQLEKRGGVRVGMTKAQVLKSSWGEPASVNATTTRNGDHEQWVYENGNYLYFDNGILSAIQNLGR